MQKILCEIEKVRNVSHAGKLSLSLLTLQPCMSCNKVKHLTPYKRLAPTNLDIDVQLGENTDRN